ncbi:MAG: hypothetical protein M3347_09885 [Armatimonadota bacterium]|nr:hypothetical protein [Armatimonadota bacterium]
MEARKNTDVTRFSDGFNPVDACETRRVQPAMQSFGFLQKIVQRAGWRRCLGRCCLWHRCLV